MNEYMNSFLILLNINYCTLGYFPAFQKTSTETGLLYKYTK